MHDLHDMGDLGAFHSRASDINDLGEVIGVFETGALDQMGTPVRHGFVYRDGEVLGLGGLGGQSGIPLSINNSGHIVGYAEDGSGNSTAFLYENGAIVELGSLGGGESVARDVNEFGAIVGHATIADTTIIGSPIWHAFIYKDGLMTDLNTLLPQGSGWVLSDAVGINSRGQIAAIGRFEGQNRALLLTPVPEPTTAALAFMTASVFALCGFTRRRRTSPT